MELVDTMVAALADAGRATRYRQAQAVEELIGPPQATGGGLQRLLQRLELAGHGYAVRTWTAPGTCCRISPQQMHAALGDAEVERMAGRAGLTGDELTAALSQHLPGIVWRLAHQAPAAAALTVGGGRSNSLTRPSRSAALKGLFSTGRSPGPSPSASSAA